MRRWGSTFCHEWKWGAKPLGGAGGGGGGVVWLACWLDGWMADLFLPSRGSGGREGGGPSSIDNTTTRVLTGHVWTPPLTRRETTNTHTLVCRIILLACDLP